MSAGQANMPKRKMIAGNQTAGMVDNYGLSDERSFINNIFEQEQRGPAGKKVNKFKSTFFFKFVSITDRSLWYLNHFRWDVPDREA